MWYDNSRILSYNKILNFIIGNRGGGKSFNAKKWCINDFKKRSKEFIWIRRYKTELAQSELNSFFDDIRHLFPDDVLEIKGKAAYCNGKLFGRFIPLSTSSKEKSVPFPNVNKIIFDEFIIDKSTFRYLKNEVDIFLEFYETVARMRDDVRAVFIGNAISSVNPYFLYWNIRPDLNSRFTVREHIVIEIFKDADFIKQKKETRFGQLIDGTDYGNYAIENEFFRDDDTFICDKTKNALFMMSIKYCGRTYGFWIDYNEGLIYVNEQYDPYSYNNYAITKDDHSPNLLLIQTVSNCKAMERILFSFRRGLLRFSNMVVKNQFYEFISFFQR